jgi:hypothetical protein
MSDDLVDQLRNYGDYGAQRAADEIVRLRAIISNDADWKFSAKRRLELFREQRKRANAAEAERDRLRYALALAVATFEDMGLSPKDVVLARGRAALKGDTP